MPVESITAGNTLPEEYFTCAFASIYVQGTITAIYIIRKWYVFPEDWNTSGVLCGGIIKRFAQSILKNSNHVIYTDTNFMQIACADYLFQNNILNCNKMKK